MSNSELFANSNPPIAVQSSNRLRWLVMLPSVDSDQALIVSRGDIGERLDSSHWIPMRDARSQRAPGSYSLRLETLDGGQRSPDPAFWLAERDLLPTEVQINRMGPKRQLVTEVELDGNLVLGRIVSGFDVNALFIDTEISDAKLKMLQRIGLDTAVRHVTVKTQLSTLKMADWALLVMQHVFGPSYDDAMTPKSEVYLEVIAESGMAFNIVGLPGRAQNHALVAAWDPWGLTVVARDGHAPMSANLELMDLVRDLQEVHALARLQQWHLLELSAAINSDRIRPNVGDRVAEQVRGSARKLRMLVTADDRRLDIHLKKLRARYLKLLQSGIFSYVNRITLAQEIYDGVRTQVRLEQTHEEVRLELDLLAAHVDTRMRERGLEQDRAFQTRIKVWGALIAVASMFAALFQLLTPEARAVGCGLLDSDAPTPLLDWINSWLCNGGGSSLIALLIGFLAFLMVRFLSER